ncbi:MAG: hypothetical protein ND866_11145 [Pyrinomonadaceae bacterium]|nr:hypothetical protein [Pyrinomonadaceae bacterium]
MNKFLLLSVSVVLVLLVALANEAKAQTDAQVLNKVAADIRSSLPETIGDVEFTDAISYCSAGCQGNNATSFLGITGRTPNLVRQNVSIGQLELSVKPQMLKGYCTSEAKQRNIGSTVTIYDMYNALIGSFFVTPADCPANVTPNVAQTTPSQPVSQDAQFLNDFAAATRKDRGKTIANVELTDARSYCSAGCQINNATSFLGITARTPNQAKQNVSIGQLEQSVKPQMLTKYCNSPANQRKIGVTFSIYDMYNAHIGDFYVTPNDCFVSVTPNVTANVASNTSGTSVEDQYWDAVKNSSRVGDFQAYLNQYPYGQYAPIARLRINQLGGSVSSGSTPSAGSTSPVTSATSTVEQQYWDVVKSSSRVEDFQNYLRDYPNGQFGPIARLKISQLGGNAPTNPPVNSTAEEQYWDSINNSQRAQDFQSYLNNYPNGKYAALARLRISQLGGNTTQYSPVVSAVEEQYWNSVRNSQRPQDFQDYLNNYPNGQYVLVARLRINQLTATSPANTVPSLRQRTVPEILASAQYGTLSEILPLRKVFVVATNLDSRDIILRELQALPKLIVVGRKEDAEFFVIFGLTDQATGADVVGNTTPSNQTYLGEMLVVSPRIGINGEPVPRILWRTKKTQNFDATGLTFNRPPAVNATREFVKELKKINY